MSEEKQSFEELLGGAPLASSEDSIMLTGALERSRHPGKFVLVLETGRGVILEVSAVKDYRVVGGMIGQKLVQIEVCRDDIPKEIVEQIKIGALNGYGLGQFGSGAAADRVKPILEGIKLPPQDVYSTVLSDRKGSWEEPIHTGHFDPQPLTYGSGDAYGIDRDPRAALRAFHTIPSVDLKHSWEEPIHTHYSDIRPNPYTEFDPYSAGYSGMVPFALATRHQAPGEAIAAMAAPSFIRKPPHLEGGTFPGHPTSDV